MKTIQFKTEEYLKIPKGVKKIGANAFADTQIKAVFIPSSVRDIDSKAFVDCPSLQTIVFEEYNQELLSKIPQDLDVIIESKRVGIEFFKAWIAETSNIKKMCKLDMDITNLSQERTGNSPESDEPGIDFDEGRGIIVFLDGLEIKQRIPSYLHHEDVIRAFALAFLGIKMEAWKPFNCAKELAENGPAILVSEGASFHLFLPEVISISQIDSIITEVERRKDNDPILCLQIDKQEELGYRGSDSSINLTPNFIIKGLLEIKKRQLELYKKYEEQESEPVLKKIA